MDATVLAGEARVVPWQGARAEVVKREGDPIVAGARLVTSRLRVITTWSGRERAWVKLLAASEGRLDVASPTPRLLRVTIERGAPVAAGLLGLAAFGANSTPVQILAAMCAGAVAFGARGVASFVALYFTRAHLEALGSGITYKDPRAFERAAAAHVAVLSARGTVLLGEPEIVAIEPIGSFAVERVLALAAGAEAVSAHPFAAAILRAARTRGVAADPVRNATAHAGLGVTASASSGERLVVGGRAIMLEEKVGVAVVDARISELEALGRSVLLVAVGDRLVGLIALMDGLRPGARAAVQKLLDVHIEPALLSGEARETCETLARALDIEHVRPEVLPADRGPEVRALAEGGSVVAVVGHPLRDDGALGAADVAVAMTAAGSTPGEWAVALASDDVRDAASALTIPTWRGNVRAPPSSSARPRGSSRCWPSASASPPPPSRPWGCSSAPWPSRCRLARRLRRPDLRGRRFPCHGLAPGHDEGRRTRCHPPWVTSATRPHPCSGAGAPSNVEALPAPRALSRIEASVSSAYGRKLTMRPLATVLGFAAVTAAATLVIGWSGQTYADPPETFLGSGDVDDVSFNGELAHDASFKSGWAIKVTFENRGDDDETCTMDTELTRVRGQPGLQGQPARRRRVAPQGPGHGARARERRPHLRRPAVDGRAAELQRQGHADPREDDRARKRRSPRPTSRCRCGPTRCTG